ncbi:hypothetical protein DMUE_0799 [Dictyocoela muelleri]|nr:hypothetical protein DMUE_0799 [Dictyocoela muelleri]
MYRSNYENTVDRFYTNDEINSILNQNRLRTAEDIYIENREEGNFITWEMNTSREIRDINVSNTDISADRMIRRFLWVNDINVLQIGCQAFCPNWPFRPIYKKNGHFD